MLHKSDMENMIGIKNTRISPEAIADMLKVSPEALEAFEQAYKIHTLDEPDTGNLFRYTRKSARNQLNPSADPAVEDTLSDLIGRIVTELLSQTKGYCYAKDPAGKPRDGILKYQTPKTTPVKPAEIYALPKQLRPQLTGTAMMKDMDVSYREILDLYYRHIHADNDKDREQYYYLFRQGLDIQDLDPVTYEMLGMNRNSFGYWFPALVDGCAGHSFFQIPKTIMIKVPITLLQMSRLDYHSLTSTTMRIVNEFCKKAFFLDESKEYFVKTGTYSSKFNFRNAHVHGAKEVRELGEYLLFLNSQACVAASPLCLPAVYGMSTTNEWVVREYIRDKENNPSIYQGMPLHTEYRVFVDFDTDEILGMSPYWESEVMKDSLGNKKSRNDPHQIHDYTIFLMHEKTLLKRYEENKDRIEHQILELIPDIRLTGQWSLDIMQNGEDFYIIDMALAANSALKECIPKGKLMEAKENWIPVIPKVQENSKET